MSWYVIHTKPQQEFRALDHLHRQGYHVFLPTCDVQVIQRGRLTRQTQALFKRYIFIELDDVTSNWMPIRSTRGVHQLLLWPISKTPIVVQDALIQTLRNCHTQLQGLSLYQAGQALEVVDGALKGLQGFFQDLSTLANGELRAHLLVDFLGKQQTLALPITQVKPI